jgi:hypothetical protein
VLLELRVVPEPPALRAQVHHALAFGTPPTPVPGNAPLALHVGVVACSDKAGLPLPSVAMVLAPGLGAPDAATARSLGQGEATVIAPAHLLACCCAAEKRGGWVAPIASPQHVRA